MARQLQRNVIPGFSVVRTILIALWSSQNASSFSTWTVGDDLGTWTIPASTNDLNYTAWADARNIRFGDELIFSYANTTHSVLLVNASSFLRCNVRDPVETYISGKDKIILDVPGVRDYYFICGTPTMCRLQQKLHITIAGDVPWPPPLRSPPAPPPSPSGAPNSLQLSSLLPVYLSTMFAKISIYRI